MNDSVMRTSRKKTPADTTPFEREQLRFFLSGGNLASTLSELNPSLAWLPFLWEAKLVESDAQLVAWVERNFSDVDAVRDVAANVQFFGPESAAFLEFRLNAHAETLPPLLSKCWALILRHMRSAQRGLAQNEWFEVLRLVKQGNHSSDLLERLSNALRPKLRIGKRLNWYNRDTGLAPEYPTDLMSIRYEVNGGVSSRDVLNGWPKTLPSDADEELLRYLTSALGSALGDATDAGIEGNEGYGVSDADVPSVAPHRQNAYRSGFQTIVRVMADVWSRLASKSPVKALACARLWRDSQFRLMRRLGMFAFANPAMPGSEAADAVIKMTSGELFLTGASVEAYRLIRERWNDFPARKRSQILRRLREGPPKTLFRDQAHVDLYVDQARYDFLADMVRQNIDIGQQGKRVLNKIQARWPEWQPKPTEKIGFRVWHESGFRTHETGTEALNNEPDDKLISRAREIAAASPFGQDETWQNLCIGDPDRAVRALDAAASSGGWPKDFWEQALWSRTTYADSGTEIKIAQLLLRCPSDEFGRIAAAASSWLESHAKTLTEDLLWPLWDRIADAVLVDGEETNP
ncbi:MULTISPECIES: hypothetical protein [unclassified Bradyrhizobium]|uniref:hypothetical protein n=1 Tax=unclassified Bradyrhizobium TaxID=2631580 RepID=UPI0029168466|nr:MULTISPECIES: hypothetical protein [unclassified Bradyrhizobium]